MPSSRRIVSLPESNIRCCFTTAIALLALIVVPGLRPASTLGQSGDEPWSPSLQLGVPDEASAFPVLVPDTSGGLHLFWVGERSADISPSGPAYYHRYWDGREWSPPVDILTSPHRDGFLPVDTAGGPSVALDSRGWLHVIWVGSSGRMYYSSAPTDRASSARAWSAPRVLSFSALGTTAMVAGQDSTLHLLYDRALDNPGVSYMQSADGGETWSEPVDVSGEITPDEFAVSVRLAIDGRGWLHAGWHHRRVTPERIFPIIARYARSEDGGRNWSEPMTVEAEVGAAFVNPVVDKQDNVHLFWIGPGGQRYHRWSSDGGYTWTEPERIFPVFAGAWNGWVAAAVDSAGTLHAVTGGASSLYSRWTGTTWTKPVAVDPATECDSGPHFFDLAITEGNLLHLVRHISTSTTSTVCYSSLRTAAPYVPPQPLPTPLATPTRQASPTATLAPTVTLTRTPAATPNVSAAPPESMAGSNSSFAVVIGVMPVVLLVGLVVLTQIIRVKRRF